MKKLNDIAAYKEAFRLMVDGKSVMPVGLDKKPLLNQWKILQTAPATEEDLKRWWTKWPHAGIGLITGKISGITVVDIDTTGGNAVPLDTFPATYTVKTPTGGYHLYYGYDASIQQTANTFPQFPHVDIRNTGGFVVCPPSQAHYIKDKKTIKGGYEVIKNISLAPFPAHLFLSAKGIEKQKPSVSAILKGFNALAEGDGRNNALTKVVGKIVKLAGHDASVAWSMTLSANKQFKKPLDEDEVKIIFDSISKKEQSKPLAEIEFLRTDKGVIIANVENVYRTMQADGKLKNVFRINTFAGAIETIFKREDWEGLQKVDIIRVQSYLMSMYPHFTKIPTDMVEGAIMCVAEENKVSPPVQWLKSLVWDNTPRLDTWLNSTCDVPVDAYHAAVASNWLKGMVKRLLFPGCKFDYVLVLEGRQGIRKSTLLGILGGSWHVETVFTPDNKDFFMLFGGNAIVEFAEGETLSRTEAKHLKGVLSMQFDKYRPPYDRSVKVFPRQCVFAMTTNQDQYLKDETGNRRWLPVAVKKQINTEWAIEHRDQLFAEAYHRVVVLKESVHEFPADETAAQQAMRQTVDPRADSIHEWYFTVLTDAERYRGITTRMAYIGAVYGGFEGVTYQKEMSRSDEIVIGSILRETIRLERRRSMEKGSRAYSYFPTQESENMKPDPVEAKISTPQSLDF